MDIFTIAKALGADDVTSPTIPFEPPSGYGTPTPTPGQNGPSISLETNVVSLKKGDQATINVVINSGQQELKSFSIQITYNPNIFKIIDADPNTAGVQITYANTFFLNTKNQVDELNGVINIEAAASGTATATITDKIVANIEVEALADGAGEFKVVKSSSSLMSSASQNILQTVNGVTINVAEISETLTPTPLPSASALPTPQTSYVTPRTGIVDDFGNFSAVVIGSFLIIAGIYLFRKKQDHDLR
jgi:hypothetical protein